MQGKIFKIGYYSENTIDNYPIGGGTGDTIDTAYVGTMDDLIDFEENVKTEMFGWVEKSQEYTLAWHNGKFFKLYTDIEYTVSQQDIKYSELISEDSAILFYDYLGCGDNDIFIFGLYSTSSEEIPDEKKLSLIMGEEKVREFLNEVEYYLNFDHGCIDPDCDAYECKHPSIWDEEEEEDCIYGKDKIVQYINFKNNADDIDIVKWLEKNIS